MAEFFIAFILLGWLLRGRQRRGEEEGRYLNGPIIALVLVSIFGIVLARPPSEGVRLAFERYLEPLILFFVIPHPQWDRSRLRLAMGILLAVVMFVCLRSLYLHFTGSRAPEETGTDIEKSTGEIVKVTRVGGSWAATNIEAAFMVLLMPLAFLWGMYH